MDLMKKAAEMLLKGATLLSEPCPYCKGVRVLKDGHALCVGCGKEPEMKIPESESEIKPDSAEPTNPIIQNLESKLASLSKELSEERDHEKQQQILKSINSLIETLDRLKKKQ